MDQNKLTIRTQEILHGAQQLASERGEQSIETGHLLKSILMNDQSVVPYLFTQLNVRANMLEAALDKIIDSYPKVSGGQVYLSSELNRIINQSFTVMKEFNDEFVSVEVLFYTLLDAKDAVGSLLKDNGITKNKLKESIMSLRKGSNVQSATQEDTYQSLEKYAKNLNELAKSGKLDPVIGRDEEIRRVLQILTRRTKNKDRKSVV